MKKLALLIPAAALLAGCSGKFHHLFDFDQVKGSGKSKTEVRKVGSFTRIESRGSVDCDVTVGPAQKVELTADDNILPLIETRLEGSKLVIHCKGSFSSKNPIRAKIAVPRLEAFGVSGSGDSAIRGIGSNSFQIAISGSGDVAASGRTNSLEASISGSGDMDLAALKAVDAQASIAGSGEIRLFVSGSLDASIAGSGDIVYSGSPKQVSRSIAGSGEVRAG